MCSVDHPLDIFSVHRLKLQGLFFRFYFVLIRLRYWLRSWPWLGQINQGIIQRVTFMLSYEPQDHSLRITLWNISNFKTLVNRLIFSVRCHFKEELSDWKTGQERINRQILTGLKSLSILMLFVSFIKTTHENRHGF